MIKHLQIPYITLEKLLYFPKGIEIASIQADQQHNSAIITLVDTENKMEKNIDYELILNKGINEICQKVLFK